MPWEVLLRGADYAIYWRRRPKLEVEVVQHPMGTWKNNTMTIATNTDIQLWEFYFRVRNLGKSVARHCNARLKLPEPDTVPNVEGRLPRFVADSFHKMMNPELDWFEPPDIPPIGLSSQSIKKLGKSLDLPPDPERRYYAGTIQVFRAEDGSGNTQTLLSDEKGQAKVSNFAMGQATKSYPFGLTLNYEWGKDSRKEEKRKYILDVSSFVNSLLRDDLS